MKVLIFKTDITTLSAIQEVRKAIIRYDAVAKLTIDTEDIDNVLRIELAAVLTEIEIISLVRQLGHNCEVLEH